MTSKKSNKVTEIILLMLKLAQIWELDLQLLGHIWCLLEVCQIITQQIMTTHIMEILICLQPRLLVTRKTFWEANLLKVHKLDQWELMHHLF